MTIWYIFCTFATFYRSLNCVPWKICQPWLVCVQSGSPQLFPIKVCLHVTRSLCHAPGTDVMIFKIFPHKNSAKKLALLTQNKPKLCKILILTSVFEKNANFFSENCQNSQKIVIITSIPEYGVVQPKLNPSNLCCMTKFCVVRPNLVFREYRQSTFS
jgi:hypothetical protein